jgi:hypothetical protein
MSVLAWRFCVPRAVGVEEKCPVSMRSAPYVHFAWAKRPNKPLDLVKCWYQPRGLNLTCIALRLRRWVGDMEEWMSEHWLHATFSMFGTVSCHKEISFLTLCFAR